MSGRLAENLRHERFPVGPPRENRSHRPIRTASGEETAY